MKFLFSFSLIILLSVNSLFAVMAFTVLKPQKMLAPSEKAWKFADRQLKKMSVNAKVGQLIHVGINARFANQDNEYYQELKRQVVENKIGGILLFGAPVYEPFILSTGRRRMQRSRSLSRSTQKPASECSLAMRQTSLEHGRRRDRRPRIRPQDRHHHRSRRNKKNNRR